MAVAAALLIAGSARAHAADDLRAFPPNLVPFADLMLSALYRYCKPTRSRKTCSSAA